jgi:type VI secretion system protein ImpL
MKETTAHNKNFLIASVTLLVALAALAGARAMNWPWWVAVFLALVLLGLAAASLFIAKIMLRRRERRFVQQAIAKDEARREKTPAAEGGWQKELQQGWQEAIGTLKRSHLGKRGNPLYVLPWYLVMGQSGSGKTAAIKGARLSSPFAGTKATGPTRNCDWWFFDQAVLLDTAGRYAVPVEPQRDGDEWQSFLALLVKYRSRDPLQGVVVTVAADRLLNGSQQELEESGRQLRGRINELMRVTGTRFPVWALITKCDHIPGLAQFCDRLPQRSLDQPMGVVNEELSEDVAAFLERFTASVAGRLKELRLLLLHRQQAGPAGAGLLLFPDEMQHLKPGLDAFLRAAFQQNSYQETPLFRGIFLGSARREGEPCSPASGSGPQSGQELSNGAERGLFLRDFFQKVLPRDRGLQSPTARALRWQSLTRNLGVVSWFLIGIALCGLLSFSFEKNMAAVRQASSLLARTPELSGNFLPDLSSLDRFRQAVLSVEQSNLNWWIPRLGLNQSREVESALKARYCRQFQERFLVPFDRDLGNAIGGLSTETSDEVSGRYVMHLTRRINLLKTRLDGAGPDALRAGKLPYFVVSPLLQGDPQISGKFGSMYLDYLAWGSQGVAAGRELQQLQALLKQLFVQKGGGLSWMVEFVNREEAGASITLQSFWGGSRSVAAEPAVAPAFTRKGKQCVTALMAELSAAYPEPDMLDGIKANFVKWYKSACFAAWQSFATQFAKGEERLSGGREWQSAAQVMATDQGPYLGFLKRAVAELEPFGITQGAPSWLLQLYRYQQLKAAGPAAGVAPSAAQAGSGFAAGLGRLAGKQGVALTSLESQVDSTKALQDYLGALSQIAPVARSRKLAHQMTLQAFGEDAGVGKSPLYQAAGAAQRLKLLLADGSADETFSLLVSGPVNFFGTFVRMETACSLQSEWEEKVLKEFQGASDPQTLQYLLGKEGPLWKFVSASADPFIAWAPGRGYYPKTALGGEVPFDPGFYFFLTKGARVKSAAAGPPKQNYSVTLKGLPTDANGEARTKPHSTRLELQCAGGPQQIDNLNFPVAKTFVWSPESCSDVVLQIEVGEVVLTKRYPGGQGFGDFLRDFPGGRRTFYPDEFPGEKQQLERMGIRFIRANYQISGGSGLPSGQASPLPGQVPARITKCWD